MTAVQVTFKILADFDIILPGYTEVTKIHLIFDIKIEDFRRKTRYVAGGHTLESPASLTYASVVSRETFRIALTMAALNNLEVKVGDIHNAYLTAPCSEKMCLRCGPEFDVNGGNRALVVRDLYGIKSARSAFRNHLADLMRTMGYESFLACQDLWYKLMVLPEGGFK